MLRFFQRLLGWNRHPTEFNSEGFERRRTPRTTVSSVLANYPAQLAENTDTQTAAPKLPPKGPQLSMNKPGEGSDDAQDEAVEAPARRLG